jgi:hypothetical protein
MKRAILSITLLLAFFGARPAAAASNQFLVQSSLGTVGMNLVCFLKGCQVSQTIYASPNNFFVVSVSSSIDTNLFVSVLQTVHGILNVSLISSGTNPLGNRYIVRTTGGLLNLPILCKLLLCQVLQPLDGNLNQLFLLGGPSTQDPNLIMSILRNVPGVLNVELDQVLNIASDSAQADTPPPSLVDTTPVPYYGSTVWEGYLNQPAAQVIRLARTQQQFNVSGTGIIADIDTGVDPNHPVLQPVLLPGYDFTRNQPGASEMNDLPSGYTAPESPCLNCTPGKVNQHSIAMVDQHSIAMVDGPGYEAFGHGTMVAGVLHLVAPTARILPLKSFGPDGSGYLSNILHAIYYAAQNGANIVNMSFDLTTYSQELANAVNSAQKQGIVFVASSGNDGQMTVVYPAGLPNVMGVASTNYQDQRSTFSNYGYQIVWVAAPGEAVITTYPFGTYAAAWGTSFSAPMVSGGVSLLQSRQSGISQMQAEFDMAQAQLLLAYGMGYGRIDLYRALSAAGLQ